MCEFGGWIVCDDNHNVIAGPYDTKQEAIDEHDRLISLGRDSEDTWVDNYLIKGAYQMRDYININSTPYDEECAQVGEENYRQRATKELTAYKNQLQRMFPDGEFAIKWFHHDFGSYGEVVAYIYDEGDFDKAEIVTRAAFEAEGSGPANWDDEARKELGIDSPDR